MSPDTTGFVMTLVGTHYMMVRHADQPIPAEPRAGRATVTANGITRLPAEPEPESKTEQHEEARQGGSSSRVSRALANAVVRDRSKEKGKIRPTGKVKQSTSILALASHCNCSSDCLSKRCACKKSGNSCSAKCHSDWANSSYSITRFAPCSPGCRSHC